MPEGVQLVWFKRDLRVYDHWPLAMAAQRGPVLPLYVVEPNMIHAADFDPAHWTFIAQSLQELRDRLARLGQPLVIRIGEVVDVLDHLRSELPLAALWSHEETGNWLSYQRDIAVRKWARSRGLPWHEVPQTGVVRRLKSRDGWYKAWEEHVRAPQAPVADALTPIGALELGPIPAHGDLGLEPSTRGGAQLGGEGEALATLNSFLRERAANYQREMSSPLTAFHSCSRLSAHLAWGTVSLRRVFQETTRRQNELRALDKQARAALDGGWLRSLSAFIARLHWHSHFMQKLEDEPDIEFHNFNRGYDGLRENEFNRERFEVWCAGRTGYPLVDACMRALRTTGWINFRMRSMLTSFASYDLWLHWREPALFLARQWIDYEPGIHYSQVQMQSGTTGINTLRIYDHTKQAQDQDPEGEFIRRWVPELANVSQAYIHTPWTMPRDTQQKAGCILGKDYPWPIVDHALAASQARKRITFVRRQDRTRELARTVLQRHGSRKHPDDRPKEIREDKARQLMLEFPEMDEKNEA